MKDKSLRWFIIFSFVSLYVLVSAISMIHVIEFFGLSNNKVLATSLAIAFELGAAASLASVIVLDKMNKFIVWSLFILLTAFQMMGNTFYAYVNLHDFQGWVELFGLQDSEPIEQKRILAIVSGAILPVIALGFIKALVDYIRPDKKMPVVSTETQDPIIEQIDEGSSPAISSIDNSSVIEPEIVEQEVKKDELPKKEAKKQAEHNPLSDINTQDPAFKKMIDEYINKTRNGALERHPKTIPGITG